MSCNRSTMSKAVNLRWPPAGLAARGRRLSRGTKSLSFVAVAALLMTNSGAARAKPLNVISELGVKEVGDKTIVRLGCTSRPMFSVFKIERPSRLTIDLANSRLRGIPTLRDVDSWAVSQIASTQFRTSASTISRVMINFRRRAHYTVRASGRAVVVTVIPYKPRPAELKLATPALRREAAQARQAAVRARHDVVEAKKAAVEARREADEARQAERLARDDANKLDREARRAKLEAARLAELIDSAKQKMRKLSKQALRAGTAERQVLELKKRAASARAEAERARLMADVAKRRLHEMETARELALSEVKRARHLAREAGQAKAQARRAILLADKERKAAEAARSEVARARQEAKAARLLAQTMREQAGRAKREAEAQRAIASRQAMALEAAKKRLTRHDSELRRARRLTVTLKEQIASARSAADNGRSEVVRLAKVVATARQAALNARHGQSKQARQRYEHVVAQLAQAKKQARDAVHRSSALAGQLARAESARRLAEQARQVAENRRQRALSDRQRAELARRGAEEARERAEAARVRAAAELARANRARLAAEKARELAESQRVEERKRRHAAEAARKLASRRTAQAQAASASEQRSEQRLQRAAAKVKKLEAALTHALSRERQQRLLVAQASSQLQATKAGALRAQRQRDELEKRLSRHRAHREALLKTLSGLRKALLAQRSETRAAQKKVAQLTLAREQARTEVENNRGEKRQRALRELRRAEARLKAARVAEKGAWSRQKSAATAVRQAMHAEGQAWRRVVGYKRQLEQVVGRLAGMRRALASASRELDDSKKRLSSVVQARRSEERARRQAQSRRLSEEKRWAHARQARQQAEQSRRLARKQLRRVQLALGAAKAARQREEQQLARLRHAHERAAAKLARLRDEQRLAQSAERAARVRKARALSDLSHQQQRKQRALAALGSRLQKQRAKLDDLRRRWKTTRVQTNASVRNISFTDRADRAEIRIWLRGRARHQIFKQDDQHVLALDGADLPVLLRRTLDTSAYGGPVKAVSSFVTDGGNGSRVYVKVDAKPAARHRLRRKGNELIWSFYKAARRPQARFAAASAAGGAGTSSDSSGASGYRYPSEKVAAGGSRAIQRFKRRRYFGRRIDLDFKDAQIHNILRLLSQVGNVNIVTSDAVSGRVTIRMKNVPWDQAMDVILRAKGLGQVREGNLIRVAPLAVLEKEREAELARIKQLALLQPLETRLIPLSYARASALLPKLRYTLSARGKLTFDNRTNMVIARDVGGNLNLLEKMIRNLDTQTPQVMIEARIIEARTNYSKQVGIQWGGAFTASSATGNSTGLAFPNQIGIGGGGGGAGTSTSGLLFGQAANPNFVVDFPAAVGTGGGGAVGLTLGSISGALNINLRLSAAETKGDVRIVSAPRITTLDNVQAQISQGVGIPYSQVSAAGVQTSFINANLNLTVRPHVTADGSIVMRINVTRNEPDFGNTGAGGQPTILQKTARTQMLVKDGDTAVIGGIYTTRDSRSWSKVPWFAEIPVIGWFFKQRRDSSDREEVLVFITPRIINRAQSIGER